MCYVPSIHDEEKYLEINVALVIALEVLYWSLMIYRVYNAFLSNKKERRVFNWTESMALVFSNLVLWALVLNPTLKIRSTVVSILLAKYLFVCTVRVIAIYRLFMEEVTRTSRPLAEAALIKIVINLLPYLYGGHVDKFGRWSDALLVHLCEYVKPVVYLERTRIVHEGDPIDEMLFVVQGNLWTYSSRATNTAGSTSSVPRGSIKDHLKNGDFWGE